MAKSVANVITNNLGVKFKDVMKDGIRHEFADEHREQRDIVSDLRYRVQNMINGQWWLTIPKWVYILFAILFLAAGDFGYGCFYLLEQNNRSTKRNRMDLSQRAHPLQIRERPPVAYQS